MFRSLIFTLKSKPKIFNPPGGDCCAKPKIFNQQLHDYCTRSMQESIRKLTEQATRQKKIQTPIDDLIRRIVPMPPPSDDYSSDITIELPFVPVVCILSISSIMYYFYRRK